MLASKFAYESLTSFDVDVEPLVVINIEGLFIKKVPSSLVIDRQFFVLYK